MPGRVKFIRAYAYFNLTRLYGRSSHNRYHSHFGGVGIGQSIYHSTVYEFIEKDLEEAIVLPILLKGVGGENYQIHRHGRKAKVHLYQASGTRWHR